MPIDERKAAELCGRYLRSFPDYGQTDRVETVMESLAEIAASPERAECVLKQWRSERNDLPTYADLVEYCKGAEPAPSWTPMKSECPDCGGSGFTTAWFLWSDKADHPDDAGKPPEQRRVIPESTKRITQLDYQALVKTVDWITQRVYDAVLQCECRKVKGAR